MNDTTHSPSLNEDEVGESLWSSKTTIIIIGVITATIVISSIAFSIFYKRRKGFSNPNLKPSDDTIDIVDYYIGKNQGCFGRPGVPRSDPYPSIEFFVPELPVVYQQDHGIGPTSMYQTEAEDYSVCDQVGDMPSTPVFTRNIERRKSSLRRLISTTSASDFDLSVYRNGEEQELCGLTTIHARGRLHLSLVHDNTTECVIVNVLAAASLRTSKMAGKSAPDTCLKLHLADDTWQRHGETHSSRIYGGTPDPEYNTSFCLDLEPILAWSEAGFGLEVMVCAVDRFSRCEEIGIVRLSIEEVTRYAGAGCVLDVWRDIIPEQVVVTLQGELSVSLCYCPDQNLLTACVLRARGLVPPLPETPPEFPDIDQGSGVLYVKFTLLHCGSVLKRRRSSARRHSITPAFNDEYTFDVTSDVVDDVTLLFTVFSRDSRGRRTMLGKANVGSVTYATGSGLEHWEAMCKIPYVATTQWHTLQ